jgi:ABC-type phosphate transport system substrate-binding protein
MIRVFGAAMTVLGILTLAALVSSVAQAQETRSARITFAKPTQYVDGSTIPAAVVVTYNVYQGEKGQPKVQVATIGNSPATISTGLQAGKEYCWEVTAVANGIESARSNEGCKSFPFSAPEPVIITVE